MDLLQKPLANMPFEKVTHFADRLKINKGNIIFHNNASKKKGLLCSYKNKLNEMRKNISIGIFTII
jgi:hypothetical protein